MVRGTTSILLVESDNDVAGLIIDHVERTLHARVTRVCSAAEAVRENTAEPRDVVLADLSLPDRNDLSLARELRQGTDSEVVLMTQEPTLGRAIEAMRLGVRDLFIKPFDLARLTNTLHEAADARRNRRLEQARYSRLRRVSARIIRERRTLQQRVDLVCRDLVGAYRRLAEKIVARQDLAS